MYSISTGLLALRAGGHGLVVEVSDEQVTIEGRSGSMTILFKFAPIESEISGHYPIDDARKAGLDFYFRSVKRFIAITLRSENCDGRIVFETGAC